MRKYLLLLVVAGLMSCKKDKPEDLTKFIIAECEDCRVSYAVNTSIGSQNKGFFDVVGREKIPYIQERGEINVSAFTRVKNGNLKITYMGKIVYDGPMGEYPDWTKIEYKY